MSERRLYSPPNVVGVRKLKALICYTINPLLYTKKRSLRFEPSLMMGLGANRATNAVHLRRIGKLSVDFLLVYRNNRTFFRYVLRLSRYERISI